MPGDLDLSGALVTIAHLSLAEGDTVVVKLPYDLTDMPAPEVLKQIGAAVELVIPPGVKVLLAPRDVEISTAGPKRDVFPARAMR